MSVKITPTMTKHWDINTCHFPQSRVRKLPKPKNPTACDTGQNQGSGTSCTTQMLHRSRQPVNLVIRQSVCLNFGAPSLHASDDDIITEWKLRFPAIREIRSI